MVLASLDRAAQALAGSARITRTLLGDVLQTARVLPQDPDEGPLDRWDPAYVHDTLAVMQLISELYFRGEVHGLENIPEGPVLLVGNHSGGWLIADTFVFCEAFYRHFGPQRRFHQLAHDLVFSIPGPRGTLRRWGTVPASPQNMRKALARDAALLVYPGGDHETYRPSWESSEIDFDGRTGFVKMARELDVPVVPVVAIGGQETALFLGQGRTLARRLRLDRLLRLKVLPAQIGPPLGLTVLDLPMRIPLPAKITVRVLPPIDLTRCDGTLAAYDRVTGAMQEALDNLAAERTLPIVG